MTPEKLRTLCVLDFPLSTTRQAIMDGLESVVDALSAESVECEVWADGSFLTKKIDPEDSDVVVVVTGDFLVGARQGQLDALAWVRSNLKSSHRCDSYMFVDYPAGHDLAGYGQWMRAYWIRQFGFSRGNNLKGIAVVGLP